MSYKVIFKKIKFLQSQKILKFCVFVLTFDPIPPHLPVKESKMKKTKNDVRKNLCIRLSKYQKSCYPKIRALSRLNFQLNIPLLFVVLEVFFGKKWTKKSKVMKSKIRLPPLFQKRLI